MFSKSFFTAEQTQQIVKAITAAELNTSGEIRVHIENTCKADAFDRGVQVFAKLKMHKTELRNAVLFYLAVKDQKFSIIGDEGINKKVPADFWDSIRAQMESDFKKANFTEGLCTAIETAGQQLRSHFPFQSNDTNELKNDVSFG